jgi:hypothetical protein
MAGETINKHSAAWHNIISAASVGDDALSGESTAISATSLSADEQMYPVLDFKLTFSAGTSPTVNTTVDVYRRPKADSTNKAPAPVYADFNQQYVGSFVLDDSAFTQYYYLFGVTNVDPDATFYMINKGGQALTLALDIRSRGWTTA